MAADITERTLSVPRALGRLLLLKLLARGGMGDVYLAATTGIEGAERAVVVKTVRRDHIHDGSFLARFLDEARVQAQLNHPGVAQVIEASTDDNGEPYTVVEHVEGRCLADVRARALQLGARIHWPEAIAIALEMAQALAHVHERTGPEGAPLGIVHRDLSPQNVMVGYAGEVKLIDFGTARGSNRRCHTVAGVVFAKPGYVAPEIARQQVGDGRIDVYALGVMLWELCSGRRYLTGDTQRHLEQAAAGALVLPKIAKEIGAPDALDVILERLTVSDPEQRYTAATAATELARVLSQAPPPKSGERGVRGRITSLMKALYPQEPARSRADFARLLHDAKKDIGKAVATPPSPSVAESVAERMGDTEILPGTSYRLLEKIGEGASGTVWAAEHTELGRRFAVKVLAREHGSAPGPLERFRREARVLAALSHPNLVGLHDCGRALDGRVFLVMELLEGETLDAKGARPWRECLELGVQIASALQAAHEAGLVHRDLKPHNLFVTKDGAVKLLDFGVAVALSDTNDAQERPRGFAIFGTPEYMAPEQIAGEAIDGRADLYALGCVLYEMMTGERPFQGPSSVVVLGKQLREEAAPMKTVDATLDVPAAVEALVMRALSKTPEQRWSSAAEMQVAMRALLAPKPRWIDKAPRALAFGAMSVLLALGLGATLTHPPRAREVTAEIDPAPAIDSAPALPLPEPTPSAPSAPAAPTVTVDAPTVAASALPLAKDRSRLDGARAAAKAHPSDPRKLKAWAHAARASGDLREARRAADAWALHDGTAEPKLFLASVLDQLGKRLEARAVVEEVLEKYPDSSEGRRIHAKLGEGIAELHRTAQR